MPRTSSEHTLEFLLGFNGHVHRYAGGYWLKFEIAKVEASDGKPHGLDYSFTLHGPDNRRLIGFDNAHSVPAKGARFKKRPKAMDHWHQTKQTRAVLMRLRTLKHCLMIFSTRSNVCSPSTAYRSRSSK